MNNSPMIAGNIDRQPSRASAFFPASQRATGLLRALFAPLAIPRLKHKAAFAGFVVFALALLYPSAFAYTNLPHDYPYSITGNAWFKFTPTNSYWAAVGIRPASGTDWDISTYPQESQSGLLAESRLGTNAVDFVVIDYNHTAKNAVFPYGWYGTGSATVHAYYGSDTLTVGTALTTTIGSGYVDVVRVWDVYLTAGQTYKFRFTANSGSLDLGMALFNSGGASYYAGRSAAVASADSNGAGLGEEFSYTAPSSDYYGLVVFCNTEGWNQSITLSVNPPDISSLSPSSGFYEDQITINGEHFGTTQGTVKFYNNLSATIVSWSDTQIVCKVPNGAASGIVTVSGNAGTSSSTDSHGMFTLAGPSITSLNPTSTSEGGLVIITGSHFGATYWGSSSVKFYNNKAATIMSWSDTRILAYVPTGAASGNLTVTTAGGSSVSYFTLGYPESPHNYPDSADFECDYTLAGNPAAVKVTFDASTYVEPNADYIHIGGNLYTLSGSPFTGSDLAGQTKKITEAGGKVRVRLASNGSNNYYGFKVTSIVAADVVAPSAPIGLNATPSGWTATNSFTINWTDPSDPSGIVKAWYKLGSAPTSNDDWTGSSTNHPFTILNQASQGGQLIYVWLEDAEGNKDYNNRSSTTLYWDATPPTAPTNLAASPAVWSNSPAFTITWTNPSDYSGIAGGYYKVGAPPASNSDYTGTFTGNTSFTATAIESGGQLVYVWLRDNVGNTNYPNMGSVMMKYDGIAPHDPASVYEANYMVSGVWQNTVGNPVFSWNGAYDTGGGEILGYSVYWGTDPAGEPGTTYTQTAANYDPPAFSGVYYLRLRTFDTAGNKSSPVTLFTAKYDGTAPTNPAAVETGGMVSDVWQSAVSDPAFTWSGAADAGGSGLKGYSVYWGNSPAGEPGTAFEQSAAAYDPTSFTGAYYLRVRTFDEAGNKSEPATIFTAKYDGGAPSAPVLNETVCGDPWCKYSAPSFSWSASVDSGESGVAAYYGTLDGGSTFTVTSPYTPTLPDGTHTFKLYAADNAGNRSADSNVKTVRIDTQLPVSTCAALGRYLPYTFQVQWSGTDTGGSEIASYDVQSKAGGGAWTDWVTNTTLTSGTFGPAADNQTYYFRVRARDAAGNVEAYPGTADAFTTVDASSPTAPSITSPSNHLVNVWNTVSNDPQFSWTSSDPGSAPSGIEGYSAALNRSSGYTPPATVNLTANTITYTDVADGAWYFHVRAKDNAGNWGLVSSYGPIKIDMTPPSFTSIVPARSTAPEGNLAITFTATEQLSVISATVTQSGGTPVPVTLTSQDNITWTGTYAVTAGHEGTASIAVSAKDIPGKPGSGAATFMVDTVAPSDPVLASGTHPENTPTSRSGAGFQWTASADAGSGLAGYSYAINGADDYELDTTTETQSASLSTAAADGTYWMHLRAVDYAGNGSGISRYKFIVDVTSPVYTAAFSQNPARAGQLSLTIDAGEQLAGVPSVSVTQNGGIQTAVAMVSTGSVVWTGGYNVVTAYDGAAAVGVTGTDLAGNLGSGTTGFQVDTIGPTASIVLSTSGTLKNGPFSLTLTIADASAIDQTPALTFTPYGQAAVPLVLSGADKTWTAQAFIESTMSTGTAVFALSATDAAGNTGSALTAGGSFSIDTSISGGAGGSVTNSDDTGVIVTPGAYAGDIIITIGTPSESLPDIVDADRNTPKTAPVPGVNLRREFTARNSLTGAEVTTFSQPLTLTLTWPDADNNGVVDGTNIREGKLKLYSLNTGSKVWEEVPNAARDFALNRITASVSHFSIYSILQLSYEAAVFPVPWKPGTGGQFDSPTGAYGCGPGITFDNLTAQAAISIYNYRGDLIRELRLTAADNGCKAWDGKNSAGRDVASGIYLAVIKTSPSGTRLIKKLAIER